MSTLPALLPKTPYAPSLMVFCDGLDACQGQSTWSDSSPPNDVAALRLVFCSLSRLGDFYLRFGYHEKALSCYAESLAIAARRATDHHAAAFQADTTERLGDFYFQRLRHYENQKVKAAGFYKRSLRIRQAHYAKHPDVAQTAHDLWRVLVKLGNFYHQLPKEKAGHLALRYYQASLAIAQDFAARHPYENGCFATREKSEQRCSDHPPSRWALWYSWMRLGNFYQERDQTGDDEAAHSCYAESLAIAQNCSAHTPEDVQIAHNLAISFWNLASIAEKSRNSREALHYAKAAYAVFARLQTQDLLAPAYFQAAAYLAQRCSTQ